MMFALAFTPSAVPEKKGPNQQSDEGRNQNGSHHDKEIKRAKVPVRGCW
jgi:hypothetical protein